jgi:hypothetical protein
MTEAIFHACPPPNSSAISGEKSEREVSAQMGDLVAGGGHIGRMVEIDGTRLTIMPLPPSDKPHLSSVAVVIDGPAKVIHRAQHDRQRDIGRDRER